MTVKVIVFDFDGTLIDSNQLKYDAFFELFSSKNHHKQIIKNVLNEILEESRYVILREIIKRLNTEMHEDELDDRVQKLANRYNKIVVDGAKHCNEKPGAKEVLVSLSKRFKLYLSSTTPEVSLKEIVRHRIWANYFCDIFGYPNDKRAVLLNIIKKEPVNPDELLVVGDGKSDRNSANSVKCKYFRISNDSSLMVLLDLNLKTTNILLL